MENQFEAVIRKIRYEVSRFELIRKKLTVYNYSNEKLFEGPFGKSNYDDLMKKMNDADSIVACLNNTINEIEIITNREKRIRRSKMFKPAVQHHNHTKSYYRATV